MKRSPSIVWRFFDRLTDGSRCLGVVCKLCSTQYKFFGNTTNLRVHLINKHAIQWELAQNGHFDEAFQVDDASNQAVQKRKYRVRDKNVRYSINVDNNKKIGNKTAQDEENMPIIEIQRVNVLQNSDAEDYNEDDEATISMVRQMHAQESDEEWLDETAFVKQPEKRKRFKIKTIKREVTSPVPRQSSTFYIQNHQSKRESTDSYVNENAKDEYSVFGEYIANKLRKIKTARTRGNLQQMITTILWQAEYGLYDQGDSVKRMLLLSMQEQETNVLVRETSLQDVNEMQEEPNQSIDEAEQIEIRNHHDATD